MSVYTVHEPPLRAAQTSSDPERFAFVRDGFSVAAFLFAPLWMLWHRMWLVLIGYLVILGGVGAALRILGFSPGVAVLVGLLISLLVGLEAGTLRRFTLSRRRWKNAGIVSADNLEDAERRFFDVWVRRSDGERGASAAAPSAAGAPAPAASPIPRMPHSPGVIGLFPEPGAPR